MILKVEKKASISRIRVYVAWEGEKSFELQFQTSFPILSVLYAELYFKHTYAALFCELHDKEKKLMSEVPVNVTFHLKNIADLLAYKQYTALHIQLSLHMLPYKSNRNSLLPPYGIQYQNKMTRH